MVYADIDAYVDGSDDEKMEDFLEIEGVQVRAEGKTRGDRGYRGSCPFHSNCGRPWRAISTDVRIFGRKSCTYFFGCWIKAGLTMDREQHKSYRPTQADIRRYIADLDSRAAS